MTRASSVADTVEARGKGTNSPALELEELQEESTGNTSSPEAQSLPEAQSSPEAEDQSGSFKDRKRCKIPELTV